MTNEKPLNHNSYISLETYRKSGIPVRTPVWFAMDESGKQIYIWTELESGKVKRIRNNPDVTIAPSDVQGNPKGDYLPGVARIALFGSDDYNIGLILINRKYGLLKKIFDFFMRSQKQNVVIVIDKSP